MFIKYEYIGDKILINVPDSSVWEIRFRLFNEDGDEDYNLYLTIDGKEIELRDTDYWCQGRPQLSYRAVGEMYEEIVEIVTQMIAEEPNLRVIDIDEIEAELIEHKYAQLWLDKGFVKPNKNGSW